MKKTITFQADNLNYDLNGKTLIENVSLYVERGELLYICGTFYSGINALSDIMMGRTEPASGRFYFCGTPVKSSLSALPIGRIGTQSMLIDQMTIAENLCLIRSGAPRIVKRAQIKTYTETLLSIYHIPLSADTRISDLSAIEKRVIEILKLVLAGCPLIIIDSTVCYTDNGNRLLCEFINTFRKHGISFIVFGNKPTWFFKEADRTMIFRKNHVASYIMKDGRHYTGEEVIRMMSVIFREKIEDESLPDIEEKRDILEISTNNASFSDSVRIREGEAACFLTLDLQFAEKLAKAFGMLSYRSRRKHTVQIFDTEWTVRRVKGCSVSLLSFNDIENMICGDISDWGLLSGLKYVAETWEKVKELYKEAGCPRKSDFVEQAVRFYVGYLTAENKANFLPNMFLSNMKSIVRESDNRNSKMLFKLAVEIAMVENILANLSKYDPLSVARLRGQCVEEVKGINGMLQFEDAVDWQEAWRE